jgi:cholest-4-en-3-one 26-monooxygenase
VAKLEPKMREVVKGLVDAFIERGECDLVQDLAAQVSVRGALSMIGLPLELAERGSGWVNGIFARRDGHRGATEKSMEGAKDMFFTILDHVKQARKNPRRRPACCAW